jgi:hypothetical protein
MKTKLVFVFFVAFAFGCKAQDIDFNQYLNNFGNVNLPILSSDTETWKMVFNQEYDNIHGRTYKSVSEKYVKKYICTDGNFNSNMKYYIRYDYGVKIDISNNFYTVLLSKLQYEGNSEWDYDLTEDLLITYTKSGKMLSTKSLTKDNGDRWQSNLTIKKDKVIVQQIKNTALKVSLEKIMPCEVWSTEYQISDTGIIGVKNTILKKIGKIKWNKKLLKYELVN